MTASRDGRVRDGDGMAAVLHTFPVGPRPFGRMTVIGFLSVAPTGKTEMAEDVAAAVAALDDFDVAYETDPMGTTIEADDIDELLAAVAAAHNAVEADRVGTFLKIDDKRTGGESAQDKVDAVADALGREPRKERR